MRLVTFRYNGLEAIGAFVDADRRVIRLQTAEELRSGQPDPRLTSMLAFLRGGEAARDAAAQAIDFAVSQRPDGIELERGRIKLLSPVPRPESIRDFMVFEQHVINCIRRFGMSGWLRTFDEWLDDTFGRKATLAYRMNRAWYERPVYYKGNRMTVVGDGAEVTIPAYTERLDWELEFGIFLSKAGRDIPGKGSRLHRRLHDLQRLFGP